MPSDGVKQKKTKTAPVSNNTESRETQRACEGDEEKKDGEVQSQRKAASGRASSCSSVDIRTIVSLLSLTASFVLAWVILQQNAKLNEAEEKYQHLYDKAGDLLALEKKFSAVSEKCENVQVLLANQELQSSLSQLSSLEQEVTQLKVWTSGVTERHQKLQENLLGITQAIELIENRTAAISSDVTAKVASVRTDVRRMGGLEGDVDALVTQTSELEKKVAQAEKLMAKRIGELLAASIERVSGLRSSTEKNTQNLEQIRRRLPELYAADKKLSERLLTLESSRAKVMRTVTFASDLRPRVSTMKRDFAMVEPQLAELTLRIGNLAEEVMKTQEDIAQMKESVAKLAAVRKDVKQAQEELALEPITDILYQNDLNKTLLHSEL